jgi:L-ribulokinase
MENVIAEKVGNDFRLPGQVAGNLTEKWSKVTRLNPGTPVVVAAIDAHAAVPACTVTTPGKLVMILGTSTCHMLLGKKGSPAEGICGVVDNGIIPGLWGYEAGQSGVGDVFAWYMKHGVPESAVREAKRLKKSIYQHLEEQASELVPGESGLLALDWWNGNRSVLVDADLTGLMLGMDLSTRPHQIYRALIEATAFGTRRIIDAFTESGIRISELYACGGLAQQNTMLMQIYSDVTGRPIRVADSEQTSALGAAMHAAVAVGAYSSFTQAANAMAKTRNEVYRPNRDHTRIYDELYREYLRLHDQFGRDAKSSMKVLKNIRRRVSAG